MKLVQITLASLFILIAGCTNSSKDVTSMYISPLQYRGYDCDQLIAESTRINVRATEVAGGLDQAAAKDAALTGVGVVLFWPTLLALGSGKANEAEYGRLKGERDAVDQAIIINKCSAQKLDVSKETTDPK